jgi:hypothetical protein
VNASLGKPHTVNNMLHAIVSISPDTNTIGGLRNLLVEAAQFNLDPETELLDGTHVALDGNPEHTIGMYGNTLAAVAAFVDAVGLPDDTELRSGTDLFIDLPVFTVNPIACGSHTGALPNNLLVTVNPSCETC